MINNNDLIIWICRKECIEKAKATFFLKNFNASSNKYIEQNFYFFLFINFLYYYFVYEFVILFNMHNKAAKILFIDYRLNCML